MAELKIGRDSGCDIVINDPTVSRLHATIIITGTTYSIKDNGSVNGTFINGKKITDTRVLQSNDILKVGNTVVAWKKYIRPAQSPTAPRDPAPPIQPIIIPPPGTKKKPLSLVAVIGALIIVILLSLVVYFFTISGKDELRISDTWVCEKNCSNLKQIIFGEAIEKAGDYVVSDSVRGIFRIDTDEKLLTMNPGLGGAQTEVTYKYEMKKNKLHLTSLENIEPIILVKQR